MDTYMNQEILELKEELRQNKKLESLKKIKEEELFNKKSLKQDLKEILHKERRDVEKLENWGISSIFSTLLGNKEEKLDKEREEYLLAKLKYEDITDKIIKLENELLKIQGLLLKNKDIDKSYKELIDVKEKLIIKSGGRLGIQLQDQLKIIDQIKADIKEINEAIKAGEGALNTLERVKDKLQSAQNWGVWDILGGGLISNIGKHSAIDDANDIAEDVHDHLESFKKELADVNEFTDIQVNLSSFATFADFFLDGIFADWFVQSKINKSLDNVNKTMEAIEEIVKDLDRNIRVLQDNLEQSEFQVKNIINLN